MQSNAFPFSYISIFTCVSTDLFFIFFQWMLSILLDMLSMWSTIAPFIGIFNKYLSPGNIRSKASTFSYTCHIVYRRVMFDYSFNSSLWSYSFSTLSLLLCIWTQCLIFFLNQCLTCLKARRRHPTRLDSSLSRASLDLRRKIC